MPRKRPLTQAPANGNGTLTSAQPLARRPGISIPYASQQQQPTPLSDSTTPGSTTELPENGTGFQGPPVPNMVHPLDFNHPRHPLAAMAPELRQLNLAAMTQHCGPMVRAGQIEDLPMDWGEPARQLNVYLMDYFKKKGLHKTAEVFARDCGLDVEADHPGIDTGSGLLDEIWQVFWRALVSRHPDLATIPPQQLRAPFPSLSPTSTSSIPSTVMHKHAGSAPGLSRMSRTEAAAPRWPA